ncbi:hypothetical protein DRN98_09950 [Methanosarcinales archaeon]|nr:MAG: hypothetical protein DRN98_09950 [Methanosarcinales archaeon]
MSGVSEYRKRAVEKIEMLSENKLKVALDFIEYLAEKEEWVATWEVLNDEEAMKNIKEADESWKDKRGEEFISWEKVRRDVQNSSA